MSSNLLWMIIRKHNCFLKRRNGLVFSSEPNNLRGRHCFRYNGLIHKKSIGIYPCKSGKGVVFVMRKQKRRRKPATNYTQVELSRSPRQSLNSIRRIIRKNKYRVDLRMPALRRASAIIRSQRPLVVKKSNRRKKKE